MFFKLIKILGRILKRDIIKTLFEPKYVEIVDLLENQIDETKKLYDMQIKLKENSKQIFVHSNMPNVAGGIKICNELKERIKRSFETFYKLINHRICHSERMERVNKKYTELFNLIDELASSLYDDWRININENLKFCLEKRLIVRDTLEKKIYTNFDHQVIAYFD